MKMLNPLIIDLQNNHISIFLFEFHYFTKLKKIAQTEIMIKLQIMIVILPQ
jgi:hypothetical protein